MQGVLRPTALKEEDQAPQSQQMAPAPKQPTLWVWWYPHSLANSTERESFLAGGRGMPSGVKNSAAAGKQTSEKKEEGEEEEYGRLPTQYLL